MKTTHWLLALVSCAVLSAGAAIVTGEGAGAAGSGSGLDPARILEPLKDSWPTYSGDYSGKRYSALTQINQAQREEPDAGLGGPRHRRRRPAPGGGGASVGRRAADDRRRRRHRRRAARTVRRRHEHPRVDPAGRRHALFLDARQRLGDRRAHRPGALALLLEDEGRHAHRQSRPRRCGATTCSWRRPTTTWSRSTPRPARSAGTRKSPTSSSSTSRPRRRSSSATTCSSAPATISMRPASCSRSIRRPASCSGSSTRCR